MNTFRQFVFRLLGLFQKRRQEAEMSEELKQHLELRIERNIANGLEPEEARYAAMRSFGSVEQIKESCRDQQRWTWLQNLGQDLRFSMRGFRMRPGFSAIVISVLAIGIAANTTVFSVFNALMLRPLRVVEPERLMAVEARAPAGQRKEFPYPLFDKEGRNLPIPYPYFEQLREQGSEVAELAAVSGWSMLQPCVLPGTGGSVDSAYVEEVSGNYFHVVGATTILGRTLQPEDDRPGNAAPVGVLSYDFWQSQFGADTAVLGKELLIAGVPVTIVGVTTPHFHGARVGAAPALWVPINLSRQMDGNLPWGTDGLHSWDMPWINILVRMRPGATPSQAAAQFDATYQSLLARVDARRVGPLTDTLRGKLLDVHLTLIPARTGYGGVRSQYERPATLLLAMVAFLQVVACANIAGLLLARGAARERELALRTSLGASRGRLLRQLMTESLLLAVVAGVTGFLLAQCGTRLLSTAVAGVVIWTDGRMLGFTGLVTLGSAVLFGLLPAWRFSSRELTMSIKGAGGMNRHRLNAALVVAQVALAFVLLVGAALFGRTLRNLAYTKTGFEPHGQMLFDINPSMGNPAKGRFALYQRMSERVARVPGVLSVAPYQGFELLGDTAFVLRFTIDGLSPAGGEDFQAQIGRIGPRFFATMGIPMLQGREFDERDTDDIAHGIRPLVISAWSANRLFGSMDPIGRHLKLDADFQIVGVAADVKYKGQRDAPGYVFYVPLQHLPNNSRVTFAIRTAAGAKISARELRDAIQSIDPQAQLSELRTVRERLDRNLTQERLVASLAGFFGALALVFAGLGLTGMMSFAVAARTKEFGVRMALGSTAGAVLRSILKQGVLLGLVGCGFGAVGAFGLMRFVESLLFGVSAEDPLSFFAATGILLLVVGIAAAIPARRAASVDPMVALRCE